MDPRIPQNVRQDVAVQSLGSFGTERDVLKHYLWDTRYFTATRTDATFFTQPIGSPWSAAGESKTENETNLQSAAQLPNGYVFTVKKVGVALILPIAAGGTAGAQLVQSFYNILQSSIFIVKLPGREFDLQLHGRLFLPAIAVSGDANVGSTRVGDMLANGWVNVSDTPIVIANLVQFTVPMRTLNADADVLTQLTSDFSDLNAVYASMQMTLEGVLSRAK